MARRVSIAGGVLVALFLIAVESADAQQVVVQAPGFGYVYRPFIGPVLPYGPARAWRRAYRAGVYPAWPGWPSYVEVPPPPTVVVPQPPVGVYGVPFSPWVPRPGAGISVYVGPGGVSVTPLEEVPSGQPVPETVPQPTPAPQEPTPTPPQPPAEQSWPPPVLEEPSTNPTPPKAGTPEVIPSPPAAP